MENENNIPDDQLVLPGLEDYVRLMFQKMKELINDEDHVVTKDFYKIPKLDIVDKIVMNYATNFFYEASLDHVNNNGDKTLIAMHGSDTSERFLVMPLEGKRDEKYKGSDNAIMIESFFEDERIIEARISQLDFTKLPGNLDWMDFFYPNPDYDEDLYRDIVIDRCMSLGIAELYFKQWFSNY